MATLLYKLRALIL